MKRERDEGGEGEGREGWRAGRGGQERAGVGRRGRQRGRGLSEPRVPSLPFRSGPSLPPSLSPSRTSGSLPPSSPPSLPLILLKLYNVLAGYPASLGRKGVRKGGGEEGRMGGRGGRYGWEGGRERGARAKAPIRPPTLRNITSSNVER